jgi:tetratricopeptide (TPR) repeat protein
MKTSISIGNRIFAWIIVIISGIGISLRKPDGWDFWWYLGAGKLMHGISDVGEAFTAVGEKWHNHEWLFHWLIGFSPNPGIYHLALHILLVLIFISLLFILLKRNAENDSQLYQALFLTLINAWFASLFLILRAQIVSYILFTCLWLVLVSSISEIRKSVIIGFIMILWANVHGAFLLGTALVVFYTIAGYLENGKKTSIISKFWWIPAVIAILAPLVNPYFFEVYTYPFKWLGNSLYKETIREWTSVLRWHDLLYPFLFHLVISSIILIVTRPYKLKYLILFVIFSILPFTALRHLPFYFIYASWMLSIGLSRIEDIFIRHLDKSILIGKHKYIVLSLFFIGFISLYLYLNPVVRLTDPLYSKYHYPTGAVAFMRENNLDGRILNAYQWGGYLWEQGFDIFIDGRLDTLYPEEVFRDYTDIVSVEPTWDDLLDKYEIRFILFDTKIDGLPPKITQSVFKSQNWIPLYQDPVAVLFAHKDRMDKDFLAQWKEGNIAIPDEPMCQYAAAMTLWERNYDPNIVEKYFIRSVELDPSFASAHYKLASFYASERNDYEKAELHLGKALRLGLRKKEVFDLKEKILLMTE